MSSGDRSAPGAPSLRDRATKLLQADFFAVLDLARTAGTDDVGKAYLTAVKIFHPDRAPSEDLRPLFAKVFARIELAKAKLSDPAERARYASELNKAPSANDRAVSEAGFEFMKAESFLKTNDALKAEEHLRRAVRLAPTNVDYAALLVSVQATADASPELLKSLSTELDRLIARDPENARALFHRGQIRKRLGRVTEAMADFRRVSELNPANLDATREVRIHKMRSTEKAPPEPEGVGGFFKRLFKR